MTAACGAGGRPSEDQLRAAISKSGNVADIPAGLTKTQLSCVAKVIEDSKLSNAALQALVDRNSDFSGGSSDENALTDIAPHIRDCAR